LNSGPFTATFDDVLIAEASAGVKSTNVVWVPVCTSSCVTAGFAFVKRLQMFVSAKLPAELFTAATGPAICDDARSNLTVVNEGFPS
jgi:hypothetical protein